MTHLCVRVHEHLGKNICNSLQFWSCESISILKVILQAHQSFFAVYPVRASTVRNDVGDVLHTQQCHGSSSVTSKWHHSISQQLPCGKQAYYVSNTTLQFAKRLKLERIRRLYWQLTALLSLYTSSHSLRETTNPQFPSKQNKNN